MTAAAALRPAFSRHMASAIGFCMCFFFFFISVQGARWQLSLPSRGTLKISRPPSTLVIYEHEDRIAPGNTVVTAASASGNFSSIDFGTINVIANILTEGKARDSPEIGKAVGQVTFEADHSLSLAYTFVLSTSSYNGSLTVQGTLDHEGNGEVVITGGTYDFHWARGYAEVCTVSKEDQGDVIFKNTLYLKYD